MTDGVVRGWAMQPDDDRYYVYAGGPPGTPVLLLPDDGTHKVVTVEEWERRENALSEIFFGAWCFDDKPHRLFHRIMDAARLLADPKDLPEILRVMGMAIYHRKSELPPELLDEISNARAILGTNGGGE